MFVCRTSGHVDKFTDYMVRDDKKGEFYRADKLIEECLRAAIEDPATPAEKKAAMEKACAEAGSMSKEQYVAPSSSTVHIALDSRSR